MKIVICVIYVTFLHCATLKGSRNQKTQLLSNLESKDGLSKLKKKIEVMVHIHATLLDVPGDNYYLKMCLVNIGIEHNYHQIIFKT